MNLKESEVGNLSRKEALKYLYEHKRGFLDELEKYLDEKLLLGFELTGIIRRGQEINNKNSWQLTQEGERVYSNLYKKRLKPSLLTQLQYFTNRLIDRL